MNFTQYKNNRYKNGEYHPSYSAQIEREKASSIAPTQKQVQYRDDLHKFCLQKGIVRDSFKIRRTKQGIHSDIRAFITILEKHGFKDEFFGRGVEDGK